MTHYGQYRYWLSKKLEGVPPQALNRTNFEHPVSERDISSVQITLSAERCLREGEGIHLFIGPEEEKVIRNAMKHMTYADMVSFVPPSRAGVIYTATAEPALFASTSVGLQSWVLVNMEDFGTVISHQQQGVEPEKDGLLAEYESVLDRALSLTYGAFMMMQEFPEMLLEGPPPGMKHPSWYRKLNKRHLLLSRVRGEMAPHIRRGHFRVLRSEKFVNKRGTVIFVKPSMIHGNAKHTETGEK